VTVPILRVLLVEQPDGDGRAGAHLGGEGSGLVVQRADDLEAAADVLAGGRFDCAVLDLAAVAGPPALRALRAVAPEVAVVVVSPPEEEEATAALMVGGAEDHLTRGHVDPVLAARAVRLAVARKRGERTRVRSALVDPLTGLPSRLAIEEHLAVALQRAERRGTQLALVFVDVDGLDALAAASGHQVLEDVVVQVAERLRDVARESDSVGRLADGGFVVVCEDLSAAVSVRRLAERIEEVLAVPLTADGRDLDLSSRLRLTTAGPGRSAAELLHAAPGGTLDLAPPPAAG
jgi:diguanylate cyclase (GGDEF)-like protein